MNRIMTIALLGMLALWMSGCSGTGETGNRAATNSPSATTNSAPTTTGNTGGGTTTANTGHEADSNVPASVRAVFPDAQQITQQHKDITPAQVTSIEKETVAKIKDTDHHSYFAFATTGGTRKQIGAASVVDAGGKEMIIVYESREGVPYIKEVRVPGAPQGFLDQFKGKGHDDKFEVGGDIKPNGADDATARAVAQAARLDSVIMQTLYGKPDHH